MILVAVAVSLLLVIVTGTLRAAGASLVRTPRADALHDAAEDPRAELVAKLLEERLRVQPALGMVHTGLLVLAALPVTWALTRSFSGWGLLLALAGIALLLVLVGDIIPRSLGRSRPRRLAYRFSRLLGWAIATGDAAADLIQDDEGDAEDESIEDRADAEEIELISSVLELTDTIVREVMTPRTDMDSIRGDASTDDALDLVLAEGRSRVPVVGEDTDDIVGVLYARDLLQLMDRAAPARPCAQLMREAYFVPETKRVLDLLREMQAKQIHLAIVIDEFGGTAGLVTIEDLIEEIVGEIADEYDQEEPMVVPLDEGGYLVDARLAIDELEDLIGVQVPDEEWDTVGGLVLGLAGRVPVEGESFEMNGHIVTAERVQGRRVSRVKITTA